MAGQMAHPFESLQGHAIAGHSAAGDARHEHV